jgi:hypothetical protein
MRILSLQDRFFFKIAMYCFLNNQANLYEFSFLGTYVQTEFRNIEYEINQVLLCLYDTIKLSAMNYGKGLPM